VRFKIFSSYEVGGRTVSVEKVAKFDSGDRVGDWNADHSVIRLQTKDMSEDSLNQNFWHESFHSILDTYGHSELSADEEFVERISQGIWQVIKTGE
jgi:hypothetical protein